MDKLNDIDNLILDHLDGRLSKESEKELRSWISRSPANQEYLAKTCALWELSTLTQKEISFDVQKNWNRISPRIKPKNQMRKLVMRWAGIAAVFVLAFVSSYLTFRYTDNSGLQQTDSFIINEAPMGNMSKVTLPDGSEIWLNAGSKIKYASSFNENDRYINLKGEAYFHVSSNQEKPFVVNAQGVEVRATGTRFNVKAYEDEGVIETTLVEGIVTIKQTNNAGNKEVLLKPNQKLTIYKKSIEKPLASNLDLKDRGADDFVYVPLAIRKIELASDVETPVYTSWKDNDWIIRNEKLELLAVRLGRRYDVSIQLLDDKVKSYSYTGTLKDETLEQVLEVISQSSPIKYKLEKKKVSLWYNQAYK